MSTSGGLEKLIIVSNRGPLRRVKAHGKRRWERSAGGLVTALDPIMRARGGVWVSSQESEDQESVGIEDAGLGYEVGGVSLSRSIRQGFYDGVSNAILWPLMHGMPPTMRVGEAPWSAYVMANRVFCETVLGVSPEGRELVWVHDYHLMLVPAMLRAERPNARIGWFCHIPWPNPDQFAILPWRRGILDGLLGADLLGMHTDGYVNNFLECVRRLTDYPVDLERGVVRVGSREVHVVPAPIGIPVREMEHLAQNTDVNDHAQKLRQSVGSRRIILGVDRLDYTKGIPERLLAYERLLKRDRMFRNRYVMVQVMVPSRTDVEAYANLKTEIDRLVGSINGAYGTTGQVPIHYIYRNLDRKTLFAHYVVADVALVTPLRDGMNLVALEYVASHAGSPGALVLSEFAGAARYLNGAVMVNPYDVDGIASGLEQALSMSTSEQTERMRTMRATVDKLDVHRWADRFLKRLELGEEAGPTSFQPDRVQPAHA